MNDQFDPFEEPPRAPVRGNRSTVTGRPRASRFSPKMMFLAVMIALGVLGGAVWSLYPDSGGDPYAQNVPIVRAESKPMKVIPEDAGGMDIPHRDSTVFSALRPDEEERPRIENLLADDEDEEPLPRSQLFAGLNTEDDDKNDEADDRYMEEETMPQEDTPETMTIQRPERVIPFEDTALIKRDEEAKPSAADEPDQKNSVEAAVRPKPVTKPTPKPEADDSKALSDVVSNVLDNKDGDVEAKQQEQKKPVDSTSGTHYVQLASVKTRLAAESEWTKLKAKYDLSPAYRIEKKDLGEKGVFYRVQAGPYPSEKASSICTDIKKNKSGSCFIAK